MQRGQPLSSDEVDQVRRVPEIGSDLIKTIPHFETVSPLIIKSAITYQDADDDGANILSMCELFVESQQHGLPAEEAFTYLRHFYKAPYIKALTQVIEKRTPIGQQSSDTTA